jgi:hypothetical protein
MLRRPGDQVSGHGEQADATTQRGGTQRDRQQQP